MNSDQSSINDWLQSLSRRDLFRTAGLAAGSAALLGVPKFIGNWMGEAEAAMPKRSLASLSQLALELEGQPAGILESVEGGNAFAEVIFEPPGPDLIQRKRSGPVRFEDIVLQVPLGGNPKSLTNWMMETLTKGPIPRNGAILYADFNNTEVRRLEFFNALLTEINFPALDGASKDAASVMIRLTPQTTRLAGSTGKALPPPGNKLKPAMRSNFRCNIQGLENACKNIFQIDPIVAKRPMTKVAAGQEKFRQPGSGSGMLDCSMVTLILPLDNVGPFHAWFDDVVLKGNQTGERAGLLEWLSPDMNTVMGSILFGGLGITRVALDPSEAKTGKIQTARVEMYCETMALNIL